MFLWTMVKVGRSAANTESVLFFFYLILVCMPEWTKQCEGLLHKRLAPCMENYTDVDRGGFFEQVPSIKSILIISVKLVFAKTFRNSVKLEIEALHAIAI